VSRSWVVGLFAVGAVLGTYPEGFSPSGGWLAASQRPSPGSSSCTGTDLWLIRTRTGARRLLTGKLGYSSWAPRQDRIAYTTRSSDTSERVRLYVATPGGRPRFVYAGRNVFFLWSPNGRWLGVAGSGRLAIFRADGAHPRVIARNAHIQFGWSPSSQQLLYADRSDPNNGSELTVVDRQGKHRRGLASSAYGGAWSADGGWILFSIHTATQWREIDVVRPDGTGVRSIPSTGCSKAAWAPRGALLAVSYDGCGVTADRVSPLSRRLRR